MILPRDLLRRCGAALAEHIAFIDGDRRRTWGDMDRRAERLAAALQGLGIGKGDVCAVLAHDRVEVIEHWYACLKLGALRVGINWRYAPREMLHLLHDSSVVRARVAGGGLLRAAAGRRAGCPASHRADPGGFRCRPRFAAGASSASMRSALLTCTTASTSRRSWIRPIPSARPVPTVHMPIVREADLRGQGYRADIQHKGHAGKPLSEAQQRRNQRIARDRAFGAHPFARLTQQGGKCLRTIGLERARLVIGLKVVSHNLMRLARLQHRGIVPA